jgi:nucleotide-binding universal stress UspA family protein
VLRARAVASDIAVSARLRWGSAARVLRDEADSAALLVLGHRGRHGLRGLLSRSISVEVASRAGCPTVAIGSPRGARDSGWSPPRVVVGVDTSASCPPALGFAFHAARQRGIGLTAVHAWTPDPPAGREAAGGAPSIGELRARRNLNQALQPWHAEFPEVPVTTRLVCDDPARALVAESTGAALLVVGSRGRGHIHATLTGSVSRSVLRHGHCPIAVVRPAHAPQPAAERVTGAVSQPDPPATRGTDPGARATSRSRRWPR